MGLRWATRLALAGAILASSALAQASIPATKAPPASLEPDVRLPGAEARLGLGGGFWAGAWSELRLTARSRGEYRVRLEVKSGSLRTGFTPTLAKLEVPDAAGVREARLRLPLFSRRPAILTLSGPEGERSVRVEAFPGNPAVVASDRVGRVPAWRGERTLEVYGPALPSDPATWLSGPDVLVTDARVAPETGAILSLLAAGAHVVAGGGVAITKAGLAPGALGLGALEAKGDGAAHRTPGLFARLAGAVLPAATVPDPKAPPIGWWAAGLYACALAAYGALRAEARGRTATRLAVVGVTIAATGLGFWAWQPTERVRESQLRLLVGAGGWGLATTVVGRVQLHRGPVLLPPGVALRQPLPLTYTPDGVALEVPPWSNLTYWLPPAAASVPLRVEGGRIVNRSGERLKDVFVVGAGAQEPVEEGSSARIVVAETYPSAALEPLVAALPKGAVVAYAASKPILYVALPEAL